jgi:hypothetical protein
MLFQVEPEVIRPHNWETSKRLYPIGDSSEEPFFSNEQQSSLPIEERNKLGERQLSDDECEHYFHNCSRKSAGHFKARFVCNQGKTPVTRPLLNSLGNLSSEFRIQAYVENSDIPFSARPTLPHERDTDLRDGEVGLGESTSSCGAPSSLPTTCGRARHPNPDLCRPIHPQPPGPTGRSARAQAPPPRRSVGGSNRSARPPTVPPKRPPPCPFHSSSSSYASLSSSSMKQVTCVGAMGPFDSFQIQALRSHSSAPLC